MKLIYEDILRFLVEKPSKADLSKTLFQLGHEHELEGNIFDMEFTPNRGDCLSLLGIARDLNYFYKTNLKLDTYDKKLKDLKLDFINKSPNVCPKISFLEIEISDLPNEYKDYMENYFRKLKLSKNNFFTDISNYISYELGQPTHCFDREKIRDPIIFENKDSNESFITLLGNEIQLKGTNSLFSSLNKTISLAGIMGGESTACSKTTTTVLVECAFFDPEAIIGKSVKYNLNSDAAHKFERGVDINIQEIALRRFAKIVSDHTNIKKISMKTFEYLPYEVKKIDFDLRKINKIIGININKDEYKEYLEKLGFHTGSDIQVPSFRNDISSQNDLAEEIARLIGYDSIDSKCIEINKSENNNFRNKINNLKRALIKKGFSEVINFPFTETKSKKAIKIDNPLDKNKKFMRTSLKESLINNLLYNERRQKDSVKIFEISDVYSLENNIEKNLLIGIIASGRAGHNYLRFSEKITEKYLIKELQGIFSGCSISFENIPRSLLDSKVKSDIFYLELDLNQRLLENIRADSPTTKDINFRKYNSISEFPSSTRDFSFLISDHTKYEKFISDIQSIEDEDLKDSFIFDFYKNELTQEIKVGIRMVFQSKTKTLSDKDISKILKKILDPFMNIKGISIPGM